eukprot:678112-Lingulodinium_polyedra.AAC.1
MTSEMAWFCAAAMILMSSFLREMGRVASGALEGSRTSASSSPFGGKIMIESLTTSGTWMPA